MTTDYLNTIWIISLITVASVFLLPLLTWVIADASSMVEKN